MSARIWRVYGHVHAGELFYVGSGLGERPFDRVGRSAAWRAKVESIGMYDIRVFAEYNTRGAALEHESRLIDEHRPQLVNVRRVIVHRPREYSAAELEQIRTVGEWIRENVG